MINMEPVLKRGYTAWDRGLLPIDEFTERVAAVKSEMQRAGLAAVLVWGGGLAVSTRETGDYPYITGATGGGIIVITPDGDPSIVTAGGGREIPFQRTLTWIDELTPGGGFVVTGAPVRRILEARQVTGGTIGTVGAGGLPRSVYAQIEQTFDGYQLQPFDQVFRTLRESKRPREVLAIRTALRIATDATAAAQRTFVDGASNARALVEAERAARMNRARDFRALANIETDGLAPYEGLSDERREPLALWVAVEYNGYWADTTLMWPPLTSGADTMRAVDAMVAAVHPGAAVRAVAQAGLSQLSEASADNALMYGLGNGVGLALRDQPTISPTSDDVLTDGQVLSLRVAGLEAGKVALASAIVQVTADGARRLVAR
jgi:Xaa-Pro aminopeptidase